MNLNLNTFNVRIHRSCYGRIDNAIRVGSLRPTNERRAGIGRGRLWAGTDVGIIAMDDHTLHMGELQIDAPLYRLPSDEHRALIEGCAGRYRSYAGLDHLIDQTLVFADEGHFDEQLTTILLAGLQPVLVVGGSPVTWLPGETRLVQQGGDWLVNLAFTRHPARTDRGWGGGRGRRAPAGVDVGLSPLATAVVGRGTYQTPGLPVLARPDAGGRTAELCEMVNYLLARQTLDDLTEHLLERAEWVAVEALDLSTFTSGFVARGRRDAVIDWHQAWLPQRLADAGIQLIRVPPAYTSVRCHECGSHSTRRMHGLMTCRACGLHVDVHVNAAVNIRARGYQRMGNRGWGRGGGRRLYRRAS